MLKKHFVKFSSPGTFCHEERMLQIDSWDVDKAVEMARSIEERYGATPFCFQFVTKGREECELDSRVVDRSGRYYLGGEILTLEQVKAKNDPDDRILISNMERNDWDRIIVNTNSWKMTQPLEDDDVVLDFEVEEGVS